jgi:hypothetical protein
MVIGCGADSGSPTAPPPTSSTPRTARSIAIGGLRSPLVVGESVQLIATISYSDGSTRDVTHEAHWTTSEVATITADAVLTAVRPGAGSVVVGLEGIGSLVNFSVNAMPAPAPAIRGIVHEATPRSGLALAGVRVEIARGPYAGQATTTNYDGYFEFFGIQQTGFDLWASKRGYEPARFRVVQLPRDSAPDIRLTGQFRLATQRIEGTFAPECYQNRAAILTRSIYFTPGHDGVLTLDWRVNTQEDAINLLNGSTPIEPDRRFLPGLQYPVTAGGRHELRLIANTCRDVPPMDGSYWVVFTWPQ